MAHLIQGEADHLCMCGTPSILFLKKLRQFPLHETSQAGLQGVVCWSWKMSNIMVVCVIPLLKGLFTLTIIVKTVFKYFHPCVQGRDINVGLKVGIQIFLYTLHHFKQLHFLKTNAKLCNLVKKSKLIWHRFQKDYHNKPDKLSSFL